MQSDPLLQTTKFGFTCNTYLGATFWDVINVKVTATDAITPKPTCWANSSHLDAWGDSYQMQWGSDNATIMVGLPSAEQDFWPSGSVRLPIVNGESQDINLTFYGPGGIAKCSVYLGS
jgi:hypothetical protein